MIEQLYNWAEPYAMYLGVAGVAILAFKDKAAAFFADLKLPTLKADDHQWWLAEAKRVDALAAKLSEEGYPAAAGHLRGDVKLAMSRIAFNLEVIEDE